MARVGICEIQRDDVEASTCGEIMWALTGILAAASTAEWERLGEPLKGKTGDQNIGLLASANRDITRFADAGSTDSKITIHNVNSNYSKHFTHMSYETNCSAGAVSMSAVGDHVAVMLNYCDTSDNTGITLYNISETEDMKITSTVTYGGTKIPLLTQTLVMPPKNEANGIILPGFPIIHAVRENVDHSTGQIYFYSTNTTNDAKLIENTSTASLSAPSGYDSTGYAAGYAMDNLDKGTFFVLSKVSALVYAVNVYEIEADGTINATNQTMFTGNCSSSSDSVREDIHPTAAISGDGSVIAVGCPGNSNGEVFIFRRAADGSYTANHSVAFNESNGMGFGAKVSLDKTGNTMAVSLTGDGNDTLTQHWHVYGSSGKNYSLQHRNLSAPLNQSYDFIGPVNLQLSSNGKRLLVSLALDDEMKSVNATDTAVDGRIQAYQVKSEDDDKFPLWAIIVLSVLGGVIVVGLFAKYGVPAAKRMMGVNGNFMHSSMENML